MILRYPKNAGVGDMKFNGPTENWGSEQPLPEDLTLQMIELHLKGPAIYRLNTYVSTIVGAPLISKH